MFPKHWVMIRLVKWKQEQEKFISFYEWNDSAHVLKCSTLGERSWRLCWCQVAPRSSPAPRALLAESLALAGSRVGPAIVRVATENWFPLVERGGGGLYWEYSNSMGAGQRVLSLLLFLFPLAKNRCLSIVGRCSLRIYVLMILCVETRMRLGAWTGIWTDGGLRLNAPLILQTHKQLHWIACTVHIAQ